MGALQAVQQVASNVVDTATTAAAASAKQIAKTPLDILEELLGQSPAPASGEKPAAVEQGQSDPGFDPAVMEQKAAQDDEFKQQKHQALHDQIQQQSKAYYDQKVEMEAQQKQMQEEQKKREKFEIKQLEKRKSQDYALKAAQDASSAEKRVGAG